MKHFFDFHAHPTSKAFLTHEEMNRKLSPWRKIRGGIFQAIAPILKSQSNLTQFKEGDVRLAIFPIVPIEKGFSNFWLINDLLGVFTVLSREFINDINRGEHSYFKLFMDEFKFLKRHLSNSGTRVNILRSIEDYEKSDTVINGIIAMEGSHSLIDPQNKGVIPNLKTVKNSEEFSLLYLTLTHLTKLNFCNHAYGAKITSHDLFKPINSKGINSVGINIAETCYDKKSGKRILIDVKHMSVYSRFQFYKWRKENKHERVPILATHMGLTGFPLANLDQKIKNLQYEHFYAVVDYQESPGIQGDRRKFNTDFNPWSINLYDEEIKLIIESGGLIGLSLDQRILGFGKNTDEYFAKKEFDELDDLLASFKINPHASGIESFPGEKHEEQFFDGPDEFEDEEYFENNSNLKGRKRRHLRFFCNNLLHLVKVGGPKAWKHVCIGSDFDGLINPINNCKSLADYPDFEEDLIEELKIMASEGPGPYYLKNLKAQVRDLMFNNGMEFLKKNFSKKALT